MFNIIQFKIYSSPIGPDSMAPLWPIRNTDPKLDLGWPNDPVGQTESSIIELGLGVFRLDLSALTAL